MVGAAGREDSRRSGRGGGATPGRGGRGGSFASTPPPPPPAGGRGRAGVGYGGRGGGRGHSPFAGGITPGRGRGFPPARGGSSPSPSSQPCQQPFQRSPSSGGRGRGFAGSPGPGINQSSAFAGGGAGAAGGKLFGRGSEAVAYDRDKEKGLWKVGPPAGQRFSAGWLRGLDNFVAWKRQQQAAEQAVVRPQPAGQQAGRPQKQAAPQPEGHQEDGVVAAGSAQLGCQVPPAGRPPVTPERLSMPDRPAVVAERLLPDDGGSSTRCTTVQEGSSSEAAGAVSAAADAQTAVEGATEAAAEAGAAGLDRAASNEVDPSGTGAEGLSSASSASSDMGWASVLGAAAAAAATSPQGSPDASCGSADAAASGQAAHSSACEGGSPEAPPCSQQRHWWPPSPSSLASAQPVTVDRSGGPARAAGAAGGTAAPPLKLSIRLERQALTDPEAAMLADWCCRQRGAVDVLKLWLFDNRLTDAGAEAVARILAAHPGMQEVHLSHNMLTLRGAASLLEALPTGSPVAENSDTEQEAATPPRGEGLGAEAAALAADDVPAGAEGAGGGQAGAPAAGLPSRPCWLRIEWNRISLEGLMQELESQHARRGLVVDLPAAVRADATPPLVDLPPYLSAAAAAAPAPPTPVPASRGARSTLQYQVERCHARMPWVSCQYQLPSEAAVLKAARRGWQAQQALEVRPAASSQASSASDAPPCPPARPAPAAAKLAVDSVPLGAGEAVGEPPGATAGTAGPLLLFPDTSALLPMLGAGAGVSLPTFFTLDMLGRLAQQGRFGRALPAHEQVFLVVTDSVLKQLDGLKNDPAARAAVRRFLGQGLDAYGPAGADFLTVLGAHEGEGLLVEHDAAVAGSADAGVGTKGQRADHRIVEVALFFQQEILRGAAAALGMAAAPAAEAGAAADATAAHADACASSCSGGSGSCSAASGPASPGITPAAFPVLLLSGDNAQVLTARTHGLPAARMSELAAVQGPLEAALGQGGGQLGASLLRSVLGTAATNGLGTAARRSLQAEFDDAISVLAAAVDALTASQARLEAAATVASSADAAQDPAGALQAVQGALAGQVEGAGDAGALLPALRTRLGEWQARVRSHQDPSRILRWAVSL
ncbi:hypothetical protein ABPG77_007237 [Micractinium sp. CCAP 211/92]